LFFLLEAGLMKGRCNHNPTSR